jgi:flagellin-like protein
VPRRKGISPVIATVIIVAVTIAVAIAVAFWMTGIVGLFTAVEKLEITYAYAEKGTNKWTVTIAVNNTGTTPTSIDRIMINGVDISSCSSAVGTVSVSGGTSTSLPVTLNPGKGVKISFDVNQGKDCGTTTFNPGVSIEVKLHSTGGKEYPKLLTLP